jgi:hypothetical protein
MPLVAHATVPLVQVALNALFPAPAPVPDFVGVCDIGTGNLHAVFDTDGRPFLYCDIGGGALGSTFTFPSHLQLCTHRPPLILLTHFDQDHWRSAVAAGVGLHAAALVGAGMGAIHPQAAACPWLIPTQAMGGVQTAFYNCLTAGANPIHRRPGGAAGIALTIGARVTILKCTGVGANHSGLALMLHAAAGPGRKLLPGDAHFNVFAHGAGGNVNALVATHHGADPVWVPAAAVAGGTIAYSYGWGNAYGFPRLAAGVAYPAQNYADANRMDTAGAEGAADITGPRGNVALRWPGQQGVGACPPAGALAPAVQAAAQAVLAAAAAAVEVEVGGALAVPIKGHIAAAAAWQAMALLHVLAPGPSPTAALFRPPPGQAAPPPLVPPVVPPAAAWLTAADGQKMAATNFLLGGNISATIIQIARALRVAHAALAPVVSHEAWNAWGAIGNIQMASAPARAAAYAAMAIGGLGGMAATAAVNGSIPAPVTALDHGLRALAAPAICRAARRAHSHPGSHARRAPSVANRVATHLVPMAGLLLQPLPLDQVAGIAAGAAMQPGIATNPEAPNAIPALLPNEIDNVENAMKIAIAAAMAGVNAVGFFPAPAVGVVVAQAAVAAAMAARGAASGAPQPSCHRHPSACGANLCKLAMHYAP